ncbi:hypothetical protein [Leucothrix arctica]|uniref:DUF465 domain-containing protein n=1 Tax=Leucothrix arctica TaxID=1481894 RepID=A0A317CMQ6_9GAMM|nr:hypothetical protein [Leucothrix arctica]PWQ97592.1 hypothetical protein DKT75_06645 [Leucothrix arctica]
MKLKKLIEKADTLFNADESDRKQRQSSIKVVLKKLRKHQTKLFEKLQSDELDLESREKLEKKLALTKLHRKNGVGILKEIKAEESESS